MVLSPTGQAQVERSSPQLPGYSSRDVQSAPALPTMYSFMMAQEQHIFNRNYTFHFEFEYFPTLDP